MYYYNSGQVLSNGNLVMKGTVTVVERSSAEHKVAVMVGDHEALYELDGKEGLFSQNKMNHPFAYDIILFLAVVGIVIKNTRQAVTSERKSFIVFIITFLITFGFLIIDFILTNWN